MHFSAKFNGQAVVGKELQGLVNTVLPTHDAIVLDKENGEVALWYNILTVDGLMGNEKTEDKIVDCGCAPDDPPEDCKIIDTTPAPIP